MLGSTALGLVALIAFESAASALPPKLRRAQQQQPAAAPPAAEPPAAAPPPAAEPPAAAPPAAVEPPAPAPPAAAPASETLPPLVAGEPIPALVGVEPPPAAPAEPPPALVAAEPAPPLPVAESRAAEPPPAPLATEPAPVLLGAPPDRAMDRAEAEQSGSDSNAKPRQFGAMFDLGVPDGTMLSFVYRPVEMARFHAGAGYNGISPGLRLGAVFLPFGWGPALEVDYGHYFEGDANGLAGLFGDTGEGRMLLQSIGYDYVNFRAGMDFGGERFTFFAHGGVSWMRTTIHEFDTLLGDGASSQSNTTIDIRQDPVLSAWVPNLQLGFIVHL